MRKISDTQLEYLTSDILKLGKVNTALVKRLNENGPWAGLVSRDDGRDCSPPQLVGHFDGTLGDVIAHLFQKDPYLFENDHGRRNHIEFRKCATEHVKPVPSMQRWLQKIQKSELTALRKKVATLESH
jgi:hypothetical protein